MPAKAFPLCEGAMSYSRWIMKSRIIVLVCGQCYSVSVLRAVDEEHSMVFYLLFDSICIHSCQSGRVPSISSIVKKPETSSFMAIFVIVSTKRASKSI